MNYTSNSIADTRDIAGKVLEKISETQNSNGATVLCLQGDLGSGKTTFTQQLAQLLGIEETVNSPTFVIMKKYPLRLSGTSPLVRGRTTVGAQFKQLIHVDAYRLDGGKDMQALDWEELLNNPENLIVVEWPSLVAEALPHGCIQLRFEFVGEGERRIEIQG